MSEFSKDNKVKAWIFHPKELTSRGCGEANSCQIHVEINHMEGVHCFWVGCKHHSSHLYINCLVRSAPHSSPSCSLCIFLFQIADLALAFVGSTEQCMENDWVGN